MSREFLHNITGRKLFQFFRDGTQISKVLQRYDEVAVFRNTILRTGCIIQYTVHSTLYSLLYTLPMGLSCTKTCHGSTRETDRVLGISKLTVFWGEGGGILQHFSL